MSTLKVDTVRPVTTDGSLTFQGDSSGAGVTGLVIDSTGTATTFNASNINGGQLGGFRNLIINGNFQVNQRGAASRTTNSSAYNFDRWYYDGTDLYQVIEGQNVRAVLHAISWSGSGLTAAWVSSANTTASIPTGFTTITSGSTFTPTASTNLWIKFSGTLANLANLAEVQVEAGSTATAFEHRPYGVELALCQRYFEKSFSQNTAPAQNIGTTEGSLVTSGGTTSAGVLIGHTAFAVEKRAVPTVTTFNPFAAGSGWSQSGVLDLTASIYAAGTRSIAVKVSGAPTSVSVNLLINWTASSEL